MQFKNLTKFIAIFLYIFVYQANISYGFFGGLGECISNLCNCGHGTRYERWGGDTIDKGDENYNCPPYNKQGGRHNNICLAGTKFPGRDDVGIRICAEETNANSYFDPKIKVRNQTCNGIGCWTFQENLNWDGDCITWPGPFGVPLIRVCARMAFPADPEIDRPADPGYTENVHLNNQGITVQDEVIFDDNGDPLDIKVAKLCAYLDPAFVGYYGADPDEYDLLDLDPVRQPMHKTTIVHPLVEVLIFFIDIAGSTRQSLSQLIGSFFSKANESSGEDYFNKSLSLSFEMIAWLIDNFKNEVIEFIEDLGRINNVVGKSYGCVNVPLGPYPPPYCPSLSGMFQAPVIHTICENDALGQPQDSILGSECIVSKVRNNFIHNAVRVGYDDYVPICKNGEDPLTTDKCIEIDNAASFFSASAMHTALLKRDIIKPCVNASAGEPCIKTSINHTCSVSNDGCGDGFRLIYGIKIGDTIIPKDYYRDDIIDCAPGIYSLCQDIWGINKGEFKDLTLKFPSVQVGSIQPNPIINNVSLTDTRGVATDYQAFAVAESYYHSGYEYTQDSKEICLFQTGETALGCVKRPKFTKPLIYDCSTNTDGLICANTFFEPQMIVKAESLDKADAISAIVKPFNIYQGAIPPTTYAVNIAGYNFDAFATDNNYTLKPFTGAKSINPSSIYGEYKNNAKPINADGSENTSAVYLKGLEYINNVYLRGGQKVCLLPLDQTKCPDDTTKCILTKLTEANVVNCNNLFDKQTQYPGMKVCASSYTNCNPVDNMPRKSGSGTVTIYSCDNQQFCYDYGSSKKLCQVSYLATDRHIPSASFGDILPTSAYYDVETSGTNFNKNLYALRDKTAVEDNLCLDVPTPKCAAKSEGGINWPETNAGEQAIPTCGPGQIFNGGAGRYCLVDSHTKSVAFEPLPSGGGACLEARCPAEYKYEMNWPSILVDSSHIAECYCAQRAYAGGYLYDFQWVDYSRACALKGGAPEYQSLSKACTKCRAK